MIIQKIEIENFLCYSGRVTLDFKEGINVIIGDNGYGKSKLYDAFYWVLYDQVYVTEKKEFVKTSGVKSKIISDKAKFEKHSGFVSAIVSITFYNVERDNVIILERKYSAKKVDEQLIESNDSEFTVMKKELSNLSAKMIIDEEEKRRIVSQILPEQIKPYLWFQGEQVESLIDFNKHDTLSRAINVLSSITKYDDLMNIAQSASEAANKEYNRELKRLSKDKDKSTELDVEKTKIEGLLSGLLANEKELKENLSRAEERSESLINKMKDAEEIRRVSERRRGLLKNLDGLNKTSMEEQASFHRKMFRNKWVLKGTESLFEEFSLQFSEYEKARLLQEAEIRARAAAEK
jgi:DNA sulfur modification protein DndD